MKLLKTLSVLASVALATAFAPAVAAATETWADYSRMFARSAGQARDAQGGSASQWAWEPQSATESKIRWADPAQWDSEPFPYKEVFQADPSGNWVYLSGWEGNGTFYRLSMIAEFQGPNCNQLAPLPLDPGGRQHYVKWVVPTSSYCSYGVGVITEELTGKRVLFTHQQVWSPPSSCWSMYQGGATCLTQYEVWSDNNDGPLSTLSGPVVRKQERTNQIAKGRGMAYTVRQTYPSVLNLDGYASWTY